VSVPAHCIEKRARRQRRFSIIATLWIGVSTMATFGTRQRYGAVAQALHWATAVMVVVAFVYGLGGSEFKVYSAARDGERQLHETLGITVFSLALLRLAWRAFDSPPEDPPMPPWMRVASSAVHWALHVLLLAVPLTAIFGAWLEGHPLTFLGNVSIGPPIGEMRAIGSKLAIFHKYLGDTIVWVAGAHALAALFHHFVLRDRVLRSMLPG